MAKVSATVRRRRRGPPAQDAFEVWRRACDVAGLGIRPTDLGSGAGGLGEALAGLVDGAAGHAWVLLLRTGREQHGYVEQLLGRAAPPSRRGAARLLRLTGAEAATLVDNGLSQLGDSALLAVEDGAMNAALEALADGDLAGALGAAAVCILCSRDGADVLTAARPDTIADAAVRSQLSAPAAEPLPAAANRRSASRWAVAAAVTAAVAATIVLIGQRHPPDAVSTAPRATIAPATPQAPPEAVDVFTVAGVTMTVAAATTGAISEPAALAIAYRDQGRRTGPSARLLEVSSRLVDVDGPGQRQCLCWALRMIAVEHAGCPGSDLHEYLGYLVDARSGLITEVVDVVIPGRPSAVCAI